jgi:hypothetical protein
MVSAFPGKLMGRSSSRVDGLPSWCRLTDLARARMTALESRPGNTGEAWDVL